MKTDTLSKAELERLLDVVDERAHKRGYDACAATTSGDRPATGLTNCGPTSIS